MLASACSQCPRLRVRNYDRSMDGCHNQGTVERRHGDASVDGCHCDYAGEMAMVIAMGDPEFVTPAWA